MNRLEASIAHILGGGLLALMALIVPSRGGLLAQPAVAGTKDTIKGTRHGLVGAPYVKYSPETGIAGGLVALYYFHISSDPYDGPQRPSSVSGGASYTQKKQFGTGMHYDLYLGDADDYHLLGAFDYKKTPFDFYGVGNNNGPEPVDHYTPLWRGGSAKFTKNFERTEKGDGLNIGVQAEFRWDDIQSTDSGAVLQTGTVPGSGGGASSGLGLTVNYDTRDNIYSTRDGDYAALDLMYYGKALGSNYSFGRYALDVRHFITVFDDNVIALQGLLTIANGTEPFYMMTMLGGEYNMRGYYQGRFRDNDMAVVTAEYRLPVWWRFGLAAFADLGEVSHDVSGFMISGLHYTVGGGIRFTVSEPQRLGVRLDYGIAKDASELYFSILEAF